MLPSFTTGIFEWALELSGIATKEGVVLAVGKAIDDMVAGAWQGGYSASTRSGITADAQTLVDHARVEATTPWFSYNEPVRVQALTQSICDLALSFGGGLGRE
ncbi:hypothetical protein PsorP6_015480 [Peronosclerospora sorghi]|uniref:Uncharacterized protein n=1 Tax=Peronosclerospora sorghi TaxID=230839 RepID=A0ACC0WPW2_9STRA|nr:hypothetical protein PsorP6_015480 [Peronosclerospora sorghi]